MADRNEQARREGMLYAYNVAKEKGLEGLAEEIRFRNITKLPTALKRTECDKQVYNIATLIYECLMVSATATLMDEFEFNTDDLKRFCDRMTLKEDCIGDGLCQWVDYTRTIAEEHGIILEIKGITT